MLAAIRPHDADRSSRSATSTEVEVTRAGRVFTAKEVEERIARSFAGRYGLGDARAFVITFDRDVQPVSVEPSASSDLQMMQSSFDPRSGRFDIMFDLPGNTGVRAVPLRYSGLLVEMVEAAVLMRALNRGEVVSNGRRSDRAPAESGSRRRCDRRGGTTDRPRRPPPLRARQVLRRADLVKPDVVRRDDSVTLVYETPGIVLTLRGKALDSGAEGDVINVLNVQTKRPVQGIVSGPGRVTIAAPTIDAAYRRARNAGTQPPSHRVRTACRTLFPVPTSSSAPSPSPPGSAAAQRSIGSRTSANSPSSVRSTIRPRSRATSRCRCRCRRRNRRRYNPNSLWRNGSRAFFKDQRAHQVGDILTVMVNITDKAVIANETQRSRTNKRIRDVTDFIGTKDHPQSRQTRPLPGRILTADSTASSDGKGSVNRQEALQTNVAAVVTQVLPNGNLVVEGKQEIRVNFEMRELVVAGIVRPEDIQSDNTIDSSKIAEARIAYGGRGQITDVQQPRYGQQLMDVLLPF